MMMEKPVLRELLKKQRDGLDPDLVQMWNQELHHRFWQLPQYQDAEVIMVYLSFGSEIDTWPLLRRAWEDGKRTAVPKVRKYPKEMFAVEVYGSEDLEPSFWGIYEPISDEVLDPALIDLIVVPALAFNSQGYRIGYGGGYYDRFLPQVRGCKVGMCFPPFLREDLPVFPWDQKVDLVICPDAGKKG